MQLLSSEIESKKSNIIIEHIMNSKLKLRKQKLFNFICEKRLQMPVCKDNINVSPFTIDLTYPDVNEVLIKGKPLSDILSLLDTHDKETLFKGLVLIRNTVSVHNPPIKEVFSHSLAIKLIQLIDEYGSNQQIILETLWIITNFSYYDSQSTKVFYDNGIIVRLTALIKKDPIISYSIIDQLAWLIANFTYDGIEYKQAFYDNKFLEFFLKALEELNIPFNIKENILRAISNIIQGISLFSRTKIKYKLIQHTQSIIKNLVVFDSQQLTNEKLKYLRYSIQILFYLSENQEEIINHLFKNDLFKYLLLIIKDTNDDTIISLILHFLNGLCAFKNDSFITKLIQLQLLDRLANVFRRKYLVNRDIIKQACKLLNNIEGISVKYLNYIIKSADLLFILFTFAKDSKYHIDQLHYEIFKVISNLVDTDNKKYIRILIQSGVIDLIIQYAFESNYQVELYALGALLTLLEYLSDDKLKLHCLLIRLDNSGLSDRIRNNLLCSNHFIRDISEQIIYEFFSNANTD